MIDLFSRSPRSTYPHRPSSDIDIQMRILPLPTSPHILQDLHRTVDFVFLLLDPAPNSSQSRE